jgi:hypothetical protein
MLNYADKCKLIRLQTHSRVHVKWQVRARLCAKMRDIASIPIASICIIVRDSKETLFSSVISLLPNSP